MQTKEIKLCRKSLRGAAHVCAFFNSDEEKYRAILPFVKDGIEEGEKAFHMVDPERLHFHLDCLSSGGIDVDRATASNQLEVMHWNETYLLDGRFDMQRMISLVEEVIEKVRQEGYPLTRVFGAMEWALTDKPGVADVVEYESRVNELFRKHDFIAVCAYDLRRHKAMVLMDILRTHPYVIIGGILQENPFFVPPEQFLGELRQRKAAHADA